ncbi:hypothetical protein TrVFT333_011867 [Trichoderma virens FT-333]|nr:hypothetical protein TrVFT333_011867 [Trichoderma virens FT-333]
MEDEDSTSPLYIGCCAYFEAVAGVSYCKGPTWSSGGYSVSGNKAESVHLAGKFIRYKRIQQLDQFWAKLKEDVDVKKTAPGWVSFFSSWPVCLVVGIMVCEDVELSPDGAQSRIHEGKAELPIGQIALTAGIPNGVGDLQGTLASNQQTVTIFKAKVGKSNIFAVELRKITTGLFKQTLLRLMGDGPMVDGIRLASDEFDDEEDIDKPVAAEDLILDEFGPEDYEDMVEQGIL